MAWHRPIRVASIPGATIRTSGTSLVPRRPRRGGPAARSAADVPDPLPGQWWPPVMLERGWVAEHHTDFDLAHLHFGFDAARAGRTAALDAELRTPRSAAGADRARPGQPALRRPAPDIGAQLDVLIPAAAE